MRCECSTRCVACSRGVRAWSEDQLRDFKSYVHVECGGVTRCEEPENDGPRCFEHGPSGQFVWLEMRDELAEEDEALRVQVAIYHGWPLGALSVVPSHFEGEDAICIALVAQPRAAVEKQVSTLDEQICALLLRHRVQVRFEKTLSDCFHVFANVASVTHTVIKEMGTLQAARKPRVVKRFPQDFKLNTFFNQLLLINGVSEATAAPLAMHFRAPQALAAHVAALEAAWGSEAAAEQLAQEVYGERKLGRVAARKLAAFYSGGGRPEDPL